VQKQKCHPHSSIPLEAKELDLKRQMDARHVANIEDINLHSDRIVLEALVLHTKRLSPTLDKERLYEKACSIS
jgi:hypothetical protein